MKKEMITTAKGKTLWRITPDDGMRLTDKDESNFWTVQNFTKEELCDNYHEVSEAYAEEELSRRELEAEPEETAEDEMY